MGLRLELLGCEIEGKLNPSSNAYLKLLCRCLFWRRFSTAQMLSIAVVVLMSLPPGVDVTDSAQSIYSRDTLAGIPGL